MNTMSLVDDEVIACSVIGGFRWPTPLPTVDVQSAVEVQNAGGRGIRSLTLRDLVVLSSAEPALIDSLRRWLAAAQRESMVLGWYPTLDGLSPMPQLPATYCYDLGGASRLLVTTTPDGVHRLKEIDAAAVRDRMHRVLREMWAPGRADDQPSVCIVRPSGQRADVVIVNATAATHRVLTARSVSDMALDDMGELSTADAVMSVLFGQAGRPVAEAARAFGAMAAGDSAAPLN